MLLGLKFIGGVDSNVVIKSITWVNQDDPHTFSAVHIRIIRRFDSIFDVTLTVQ